MIRSTVTALGLSLALCSVPASSPAAEPSGRAEDLAAARGDDYRSRREALQRSSADERAELLREAQAKGVEDFEEAGLVIGALAWLDRGATCRAQVYELRGLDAERAQQRRRKDPEAASHLRSAVRNGCEGLVLELALRPELYEIESARSLNPEQRAALDRGLVIALGGARGPAVVGYLGSRIADERAPLALRRRALESYGRVAGAAATARLVGIADDPQLAPELRAGALVGLGFGRDPAALPTLSAAARHTDPAIVSAALVGLSNLAGPEASSETLRRQVSGTLVSVLAETSPAQSGAVIDALAYVAHPSVMEDLGRLRAGNGPREPIQAAEQRLGRVLSRRRR